MPVLVYEAGTGDGKDTDLRRKRHGPATETSETGDRKDFDVGLGLFQENDYICELRTKVHKI